MSCTCGICGAEKQITQDYAKWPDLLGATIDIYPVTKRGQPDNEVLGFICASCLRNAKAMRIYIKSRLSEVKVTKHALERFMERCIGPEKMDKNTAEVSILKHFSHAREIRFKEKYQVKRILNNNMRPAKYYYNSGKIFVTDANTPPTIVTIEPTLNKKVDIDFWYVDF